MKNNTEAVLSSGYLKNIKKIWAVKELISDKTKDMTFAEYTRFVEIDISEIREKLKNKYLHNVLV